MNAYLGTNLINDGWIFIVATLFVVLKWKILIELTLNVIHKKNILIKLKRNTFSSIIKTLFGHAIKGNANKSFAQIKTNAIFVCIVNWPKIEQIHSIHSKMGRII